MALFFDTEWFAAKLKEKNKNKKQLALALGVSEERLESIWKDQSVMTEAQVSKAAAFLGQAKETLIHYAGVGSVEKTPPITSSAIMEAEDISEVLERLDRIEKSLIELKSMIFSQNIGKEF